MALRVPFGSRGIKRGYASTCITLLNMKLQTVIVGLPNVGKSTLFNALTETSGFCTIELNVGIVAVPDAKLPALEKINESVKVSK